MLAGLGATVYAQVTVTIGYPSSPTDLGITTSQGYWIGQFPITINGNTGEAYCLTPNGTVYEGSSYTADEMLVPTNDATWQAISYLLSWYAPTDATSAAVDQVAIWDLLGEAPPYSDFVLDSSITSPAAALAADANGKNTALPIDTLTWASPASGTATANPSETVSFLVQLGSARPDVQIDFTASLTSTGGLSITLPSTDVSPSVAFTDGDGMAQVSVTVPSDASVGSAIAVTAYTQSVWPTQYLDLLNYNSGAQNLLGLGSALNLTTSASTSVFQSLTVNTPVTVTSNNATMGSVSPSSGSYGQNLTTITATANPGYQFVDWLATGEVSLTSNLGSTTTFTTSGTGSIEAVFAPLTPIQTTSILVPAVATQTGFTMPSSVTLTNPNSMSETASIQISTGSSVLYTGTVTLNSQQTQVIPCSINTGSLPIGNCTFAVTVTTPSLPSSTPQTLTVQSGVTCVGDLNGKGKVDFSDLCIFATEYISWLQSGTYYPNIDFNHVGSISFYDVTAFFTSYIQYGQWACGAPT
jgi:hypothetical protein